MAHREGLSGADEMRLLKGMDADKPLQLDVRIKFDWATGAAMTLKILAVAAV